LPEFASVTIVTPALGLMLTTCALMAAPAQEEEPAARAQATLQRASKLPQEHQRVWLRLIEQRYAWAVLLTLKPEDAQRERDRVAKLLHQKTIAWNDLINILKELDQRERAAISRLVRQYRTEVYETFGKRPTDLVDRQEAWYRIWSKWEKAGSPPQQQDRLMDWLADAIKASSKGSIRPLPPDPKFADDAELVSDELVKQLTQPPIAKPAGSPSTAPRQPDESFRPVPELQVRAPLPLRVRDPSYVVGPAKQPAEVVAQRHADSVWLPLLTDATPVIASRSHHLAPITVDDPKELSTPLPPPHQAVVLAVQREARTAAEILVETVAQVKSVDARPQAIDPSRQPSQTPPRIVDLPTPEQPAATSASVAEQPRIRPSETLASGSRSAHEPQADAVAQLPHHPVEFVVPRPERPAEYRVDRKSLEPEVEASQHQPTSPSAAQADQHAQVNIEELRSRIEGINLSLRNLEAELHEKRDFTADQLDSLLSRLDILVLRQKDLSLFRDLISSLQQAKVGQIDSSRSAVATMGTRIADLRTRLRENETMPQADRTAALKHLDELSDRLATLAAEK
jgi:hypothetical protein